MLFVLIDTANAGMCEAVSCEEVMEDNTLLKTIHCESKWVESIVYLMLIQMGLTKTKPD